MVSHSNNEAMLTLLVIQEKHRHDGFHIAFVPHALNAQQIADSLQEMGIVPELVFEVDGWRATSDGFAVAFLPFSGLN